MMTGFFTSLQVWRGCWWNWRAGRYTQVPGCSPHINDFFYLSVRLLFWQLNLSNLSTATRPHAQGLRHAIHPTNNAAPSHIGCAAVHSFIRIMTISVILKISPPPYGDHSPLLRCGFCSTNSAILRQLRSSDTCRARSSAGVRLMLKRKARAQQPWWQERDLETCHEFQTLEVGTPSYSW